MQALLDQLNTAILVVNPGGGLEYANEAAKKLLGDITLDQDQEFLMAVAAKLNLKKLIVQLLESIDNLEVNKHKRFETKIDSSYFNVYAVKNSAGNLVLEITQIIYQDMNQTTHEFKRPIQNIKTLVETLKLGAKDDPEKAEEFLAKLDFEADRLAILVSDMLSLSHIINGVIELNLTQVNLHDVVQQQMLLLENKAKQKNIVLKNKIGTEIKIQADLKLFKHLLTNLMDNAIKYNRESGEVVVSFENRQLRIQDSGLGIAEEDLVKIFDQFYRVKEHAHTPGSGLGLAIVKGIVDLHSWGIRVESKLGKGTSFVIICSEFAG